VIILDEVLKFFARQKLEKQILAKKKAD